MKSVLIRGVPARLQQDGWWLSMSPDPETPRGTSWRGADGNGRDRWGGAGADRGADGLWRLGLLATLIALADMLFWNRAPGLSLALFAALCMAASLALWPRRPTGRQVFLAASGAALSVLPLVELVQPLSVAIAMTGLPLTLALVAGRRARGALRFWWAAPWFSATDLTSTPSLPEPGWLRGLVLGWAMPLGVGAVFAVLLAMANPVVDSALNWLVADPSLPHPLRFVFWALVAALVWPVLHLARFAPRLAPDPAPVKLGPKRALRWINAEAILRSLLLFNLMFAVQNGMDIAVLVGGVGLPEGMSFAEYAHRGAYPLIVLALLSGGFALVARPFIALSPVLRVLLLVWVAQTIWLTFSSMLRLDLYVDVYGLTRLRLAAAIWMGLVLAGLVLTFVQIGQARQNTWLMHRVGGLAALVVYLCAFVSFDRAIAQYNLSNDVKPDRFYLCTYLGEAAVPVLLAADPQFCRYQFEAGNLRVSEPRDWREWGFRNARVRHSLARLDAEGRVND